MDLAKIQALLLAIFFLAVIVAGIGLAAKSKKAQYSETARTGVTIFAAVIIVSIGLGGLGVVAFGGKILSQLGVG